MTVVVIVVDRSGVTGWEKRTMTEANGLLGRIHR